MSADMDDYLTKPLKKKDLLAMVHKWIDSSNARSTAAEAAPAEDDTGLRNPVDMPAALEEFGNDEDFLHEVIRDFRWLTRQQRYHDHTP